MVITLIERTPHLLRYKAVSTLNGGPTDTDVITNRGVAGPSGADLRFDSFNQELGYPIQKLVSTPAATTAAALQLLQGEGLIAHADIAIERAHVMITPIAQSNAAGPTSWVVDVDTGSVLDAGAPPAGSNGFACVGLSVASGGASLIGAAAYVDVGFRHSLTR